MRKFVLFIIILIFTIGLGFHSFSQQNVYSRSDAGTGYWWHTNLPWYYSSWGNQNKPDNDGRANVFIGHNNNTTMTVNGAWFQLRTLTLESGASTSRAFNALDNGGISLSVGLYNYSSATHTFNVKIGVDAALVSFDASSGGLSFTTDLFINANNASFSGSNNISISGIISGSGGNVSKSGSGTLTFISNNTYSGTTTLEAGTLELQGSIANSAVTVESGATLKINGDNITLASLTVESGGIVNIEEGKSLTVSGALSNNGTLTIKSGDNGTGSLKIDGDLTNTSGTINVQRRLSTGAQTLFYQTFSCPVSGLSVFSDAGQFAYYKESSNEWIIYWADENHNSVNPDFETTFKTGRGYIIYYSSVQNKVFSASGLNTLNNSDLTLNTTSDPPLTYAGTNATYKGSNLVGNPFVSAIDWDASSGWTKTNIGTKIRIWNGTEQQYGVYTAGSSGVGTNGVTNVIPPMQGFWVGATGALPVLTIGKTTRIHSSQALMKSSPVNLLKLRVQGENFADEAIINLRNDATNGLDDFDAEKWFSPSTDVPSLYSIVDDEMLTNNSLLSFENIDYIQLGFKKGVENYYTLTTEYLESFSNGEKFYLEDTKLNKVTNLNETGSYSFVAEEGDSPLRFKITFKSTGITDVENKIHPIVYLQNSQLTIKNLQPGNYSVRVSDMTGRQVAAKQVSADGAIAIPLSLQTGIYIVEVSSETSRFANKIFIK